jgi:SAM-dependent methyltransferase
MSEHWIELPHDVGTDVHRAAVRDAVYGTELLSVAVTSFDFFTSLSESPAEAASIRASWNLTERTADVMLTLFSAMGLIEKRGDVFHIADEAPGILESLSPWFQRDESFAERPIHGVVEEVLRTGRPAGWSQGEKPWTQMMEDEAFARRFLKTMDSRGAYLAPAVAAQLDLKSRHRLLDVAGGSGIYTCHIARKHPHLKSTIIEKSSVVPVTQEYIADGGLRGSIDVAAGDLFSGALPEGYDVHLWSNVLHDWDAPTVEQLLKNSFSALPKGGMIVIHDSHVNREKTGPLPVANYSVFLMTSTEGKCYSIGEMEGFLSEAGFNESSYGDTALHHSLITAFK